MELSVRDQEGVTVIKVDGELDASNCRELGELFDRLLRENRNQFVVDLEQVGFMDSSGLASLVKFFKQVRIGTGDVYLTGMQPSVRRVFELTRLDQVFEVHPVVDDAVKQFRSP